MFYYNLLTPRVQRLESSFLPTEKKEEECQSTEDIFKGNFEEEMLHKLGDKIDANGIIKVAAPYKNRSIGKESVCYIKRFLNTPFTVQKTFDSNYRRKIKIILESRSLRELAKSIGKLDKLEQFLQLPLFTEDKDVLLKGTVQLSRVFALFLTKAKQKHLNLKGGMARYLVLPWVLQSLQQRLDPSLTISPKRKEILNSNRPDWDFVIHAADPEKVLENYQAIYEELAKSIFGNFDPDFLPYYAMIVEKIICKSGEHHNGTDLSANISFGDGVKNRVDITQHQIIRSTQLFELHGLDISIDIKALLRWNKNPLDEKITQQDLEDVLVNTDRNREDEGLQASLDLAYGMLHSKHLRMQDKNLFSRLIYWVTNHSRYYEPELRLIALHTFINYQKTGVAKQIAEHILTCHENHGMNQPIALQAMWVNTLITLQEELGKPAESLCQELMPYALPSVSSSSETTVFHHVLSSHQPTNETLQALTFFAFIKALGINEGENIQVYLTRDLKRLQIVDEFACLVEFNPDHVMDSIEQLPLENYRLLYDRLLAGTRFDSAIFNTLKLSIQIDWKRIERFASIFLQDHSLFKQQFGFTLLLACHAAHESFASYRTLVKYFPQVLVNCPKEHRMTLKSNFELAMRQSAFCDSFHDCFNGVVLDTLENDLLLKQQLVIAMAPWDFKQALDHWHEVNASLPINERVELGKRIIEKVISSSSRSALNIFMSINEHLSHEEEMELFISLLLSCYSPTGAPFKWNEVASLQAALLTILRRPDPETPLERRRAPSKKKVASPVVFQESSPLLRAKFSLSKLIFCCLELSPDDDALELFALAAKKNLIEKSNHLYECFEVILKHPQGQKIGMIKLWLLCKKHHIELPNAVDRIIGLKICEDLSEETDTECVEVVNQLLPILLNQENAENNERCLELLVRLLERHAILDEVSDVSNLITTYSNLLAPTIIKTYRQFLFSKYLEQGDYNNAFAQLLCLGENSNSELESLMEVLRDKLSTSEGDEQKKIRVFFEELIALNLTKFLDFKISQLSTFLVLCGKLLDNPVWNNEPPSKAIRVKIRTSLPAILAAAEKHFLYGELAPLMQALHFRQMLPPCPAKLVIKICQTILDACGKEREQIEQVHQILTFYKLLQLTETPGHSHLLLDIITSMLRGKGQDTKGNLKLFDKILNCLEYSARNQTSVISTDLLLECVAYFKDMREMDAERLLQTAEHCSPLANTPQFKAAYVLLSGRHSNLERSSRILIERKADCLSAGRSTTQRVVAEIIDSIVKTPAPETLKNAITCLFEYDLNQDNILADKLLTAIASNPDPSLLDYAWLTFDRYYKTSTEWVFLAHVLHRIVCLIAEKQHGRLDELLNRFPEFYNFSMHAAVNPKDVEHFKEFKTFLISNYPDYINEIRALNFSQLPELAEGKPLLLNPVDRPALPVCLAYQRYLETTPSRTMFVLANSLFKEILLGYINRAMDTANPSIVKETKEMRALFRIATCVNITTTRFKLGFPMLNKETFDKVDYRMFDAMLTFEMEQHAIAYLELSVLHKQQSVKEVQRILRYVIERTKDNPHVFLKLIAGVCKIAKRFDSLDVFPLIALFLEQRDLVIFTEAYDLFDHHIKTNSCNDPKKPYSLIIQDLLKKMLLSSERFYQVSDLLNSNRLNSWITDETKAILWATLYSRKFAQITESGSYQALSPTIANLVLKKDVFKYSETALQVVFEDALHCMMMEIIRTARSLDPQLVTDYLRVSLAHFRDKALSFIRNFSHCEEFSVFISEDSNIKQHAEKYRLELGMDDKCSAGDFSDYDKTLKSTLDMIIDLSSTHSHQTVRAKVLEKYPFFNNRFPLNFKTQEDRNVYFILNRSLIKFLSRTDSAFEYQAMQLMHFQTLQFEYLIENFPDRDADVVKILNRTIFTCQNLEFEHAQRLNLYIVLKFLLKQDVLQKYNGLFYQKLIYLLDKPFKFSEFNDKFFQHTTVIRSLLHSGVHRMMQRGMEMLNEIPPELINKNNNLEVFELFRELLSIFAPQSEILLSRPAYVSHPNIADKVKTFNDCFIEIISKSPIFSAVNPVRTPSCLHNASVIANTYLLLVIQAKIHLGLAINYTTTDLYEAFYTLFEKGLYAGNEVMYLELIPVLKSEIINTLINSVDTLTYNRKLHPLNLVKLLTLKKHWGPLEKKVVTIIQGYLSDLITITLQRNDPTAGSFVWEQFANASAHFRLEKDYPTIYRFLLKKIDKIINHKK